jgi:glycine hydroxymethyltransferase
MDAIAGLIDAVLAATKAPPSSKAKYDLDPQVATSVAKQATDLLAGFPLYPSVDISRLPA